MAYNGDYLSCIGNLGGKSGRNLWFYTTTDNATAIAGTDYISDASTKGMEEGDVVIVTQVTTLPHTTGEAISMYVVLDIDADGNGTLGKGATD